MGLQQLPEDVMLRILCFLPFPLLLQARLVCRQWLALLSSPAFSCLWASTRLSSSSSINNPWLLSDGKHHTLAFSSCDQLKPPLTLSYPLPASPNYKCSASNHGVILLRSTSLRQGETHWLSDRYQASTPLLSLLNPLTKCQIRLPLHRHILVVFSMGMHAPDLSFSSFYIISCGLANWDSLPPDCRSLHAPNPNPNFWSDQMGEDTVGELYDSAIGSWRLLPQLPSPLDLLPGQCDFVWWNNKFCTLTSQHVLTYDVHSDRWGSFKPPPSCHTPHSTLHALKGSLFLEGRFRIEGDTSRSLCFGVSRFDPISGDWLEVSIMPDTYASQLPRQQASPFSHRMYKSISDTESDQIFFIPCNAKSGGGMVIGLVYHVISRSWTLAIAPNEDQIECKNGNQICMKGFTFRPSFSTLSSSSTVNLADV